MSDHKHEWITLYNNLDDEVRVEYCADRDCGQRREVPIDEAEQKAIRLEVFGYEDRPIQEEVSDNE
jgi:hypothetical protein